MQFSQFVGDISKTVERRNRELSTLGPSFFSIFLEESTWSNNPIV